MDGLWHSSGGSRVTNLTHGWDSKQDSASATLAWLTGELLIERAKERNSCMILLLLTYFVCTWDSHTCTNTHTHKTRQNLTARSTMRLVYWLLSNTSGKKSNAALTQSSTQHPEKPLVPSAKLCYFFIYLFFYMFHCNGYLCLKLLYYNYETKDFLGSFCSRYHNLQMSNLIIYDTCVPVGLGFFLMFCFVFNNKMIA